MSHHGFRRPEAVIVFSRERFRLCISGTIATIRLMGIPMEQFKQMKARVSSTARAARPVFEPILRTAVNGRQIILGIDPSLRGTGYGVIVAEKSAAHALTHGTISCAAGWEHSRCLVKISQSLRDVIKQHSPAVCVVEGIFFAQNLQTALTMGEARGAAIAAVAECGLEIFEIAPRKVKQAIVGYGAAQKMAVAKMVQRVLGLSELPSPDAADALALALAHAQENRRYSLVSPRRI